MLSLKEYTKIAHRIIKRNGFPLYDEVVADVVTALAIADVNFSGNGCPIRYRGRMGWYALMKWYKKFEKRKRLLTNSNLYSYVDPNQSPSYICEQRELIDKIKNTNVISERTKNIILLYYCYNMTFDEIGTKYNISKQRVEQLFSKGMKKLKEYVEKITK